MTFFRALLVICALSGLAGGATYADHDSTGVACPQQDKCAGGAGGRPFYDRNCECDPACHAHSDCCVDVRRRQSARPDRTLRCLHYGQDAHSGVYAVSQCARDWTGPREVKEKCEGNATDFSDPLGSAPLVSGGVTYRNAHCALCNHAPPDSLKVFSFRMSCEGLSGMSEEQIMEQIRFDERENAWGVDRSKSGGPPEFQSCLIIYELPAYLEKGVRFCRANVVSVCAPDWTRAKVRRSCEEYMAVVYSRSKAYRNPYCAFCNHVTASQLSCHPDTLSRKRPLPMSVLIDINERGSGTPSCGDQQLYDPYFKQCRQLACAVPGYVPRDGKCVRGN